MSFTNSCDATRVQKVTIEVEEDVNIQGWRGTKSGRIAAVAVAICLVAFSLPIGGAGASGFTATANQNVNERSRKAATTSCATGFVFVGGTSVASNNWTTGASIQCLWWHFHQVDHHLPADENYARCEQMCDGEPQLSRSCSLGHSIRHRGAGVSGQNPAAFVED
jgi:hypothetical protein